MKRIFLILLCLLGFNAYCYGACSILNDYGFEDGWTRATHVCVRYVDDDWDAHSCASYPWMSPGPTDNYLHAEPSTEVAPREGTYTLKNHHDWATRPYVGNTEYNYAIADNLPWRHEYWWLTPTTFYRTNDRWFRFSIFFPATWTPSPPDAYSFYAIRQEITCGDDWARGPAIGLYVQGDGTIRYDRANTSVSCPTTAVANGTYKSSAIATVTPGAWHDFVLHVVFDWMPVGTLEIWLRKGSGAYTQIVDTHNVITMFNQEAYAATKPWGIYCRQKFGFYTWFWKKTLYPTTAPNPSIITGYYDALRIGNQDCALTDMVLSDASATGVITSPTADDTYATTSTPITLEGTSTGATSVTYTTNRGESGACTGTDTWTCSNIVLLNGVNNIVVNFVGAAVTNHDELAVTKYTNATDTTTLSHTEGSLYFNWQGTNNAKVYLTASVNSASTAANTWTIGMDAINSSTYYAWDTIVTTGYETDTISNRGASADGEPAQWDPTYFTLSTGYHYFNISRVDSGALLESITFHEYSTPAPASPGMLGIYSATGGHPSVYSATEGFPIIQ